jgi:L-rhamnose mutarotase
MNKVIFGQLGRLKRDKIEEYRRLHADAWPGVLKTITECHLQNYSIFLYGDFVFAYFEYTGENYEADMAKMAEDTITQDWWTHTKPCFERYGADPKSEFYCDMEQIFFHA